jgi:hypothetical protein
MKPRESGDKRPDFVSSVATRGIPSRTVRLGGKFQKPRKRRGRQQRRKSQRNQEKNKVDYYCT